MRVLLQDLRRYIQSELAEAKASNVKNSDVAHVVMLLDEFGTMTREQILKHLNDINAARGQRPQRSTMALNPKRANRSYGAYVTEEDGTQLSQNGYFIIDGPPYSNSTTYTLTPLGKSRVAIYKEREAREEEIRKFSQEWSKEIQESIYDDSVKEFLMDRMIESGIFTKEEIDLVRPPKISRTPEKHLHGWTENPEWLEFTEKRQKETNDRKLMDLFGVNMSPLRGRGHTLIPQQFLEPAQQKSIPCTITSTITNANGEIVEQNSTPAIFSPTPGKHTKRSWQSKGIVTVEPGFPMGYSAGGFRRSKIEFEDGTTMDDSEYTIKFRVGMVGV